ncbi:hypothetical protein KSP40_PGU002435 [Platanthera guangdongensis]|uniref:RCK N-terminal domain-containing protein n=1 Tax=Platanthera guangdongensis TaxID=2320717 RepID=A0ABR2MGN1_9ASPA
MASPTNVAEGRGGGDSEGGLICLIASSVKTLSGGSHRRDRRSLNRHRWRGEATRKLGFPILYGDGSRPAVLNSAGISSPKAVMVMYTEKERAIKAVQRIRLAFPASSGSFSSARVQKAGATDAIPENAEDGNSDDESGDLDVDDGVTYCYLDTRNGSSEKKNGGIGRGKEGLDGSLSSSSSEA